MCQMLLSRVEQAHAVLQTKPMGFADSAVLLCDNAFKKFAVRFTANYQATEEAENLQGMSSEARSKRRQAGHAQNPTATP